MGVTSPLPILAYKHRHDRIPVRSDPKAPVQFSGLSRTPCPRHYQWKLRDHNPRSHSGFEPETTIPILDKRAESNCTAGRCLRTRTAIKGFGDPYADHCTKHPYVRFSRYLTNRYIPGERLPRSHPPVNHNNTLLLSTDFIHNKT